MEKKMQCPHCGKEIEYVCARCWRCKDCVLDCREHMKRSIDGVIAKVKNKRSKK